MYSHFGIIQYLFPHSTQDYESALHHVYGDAETVIIILYGKIHFDMLMVLTSITTVVIVISRLLYLNFSAVKHYFSIPF